MPDPAAADDGSGPNIGGGGGGGASMPKPDPTVLTTQALYREIAALDTKFTQKIEGVLAIGTEVQLRTDQNISLQVKSREEALRAIKEDWRHEHAALIARVEAIQISTKDLRESQIKLVAAEVAHLGDTVDERFRSIATQFLERDTRSERESRDNKVAVDAAFAAQKEAAAKQEETFSKGIDKSEAATQETINKLTELFRTTNQGLSDKVDDLKQRMVDMDKSLQLRITEVSGVANGTRSEKRGARDDRAGLYAGLAAIATLLVIGLSILAFVK